MKKKSKNMYRFAHTPKSSKGLGDFYGQALRQPLGKLRSDTVGMVSLTPKELKIPPKSIA